MLGHYIMDGGGEITDIAVTAERMDRITPCGGCRQRLAEFSRSSTRLHLCDQNGVVQTLTMGDILPLGFSGEILK
jgi:cytidine deaminase